jgi:hypothetical protein
MYRGRIHRKSPVQGFGENEQQKQGQQNDKPVALRTGKSKNIPE